MSELTARALDISKALSGKRLYWAVCSPLCGGGSRGAGGAEDKEDTEGKHPF